MTCGGRVFDVVTRKFRGVLGGPFAIVIGRIRLSRPSVLGCKSFSSRLVLAASTRGLVTCSLVIESLGAGGVGPVLFCPLSPLSRKVEC